MVTPSAVPFVALIPARYGSSRFPGKPLEDIHGKPMVVRVAEQAVLSGASRVAVVTDDDRIEAAVSAHGFEVVRSRKEHPSGTDRLAEAAQLLGLAPSEIVVNVQGDEPLIDPILVAKVAQSLAMRNDCDMGTAVHPMHRYSEFMNPNVVKAVLDHPETQALMFSRAPIPWPRDAFREGGQAAHAAADTLPPDLVVYRHIGIYAYRVSFLAQYPNLAPAYLETVESLEQLRALSHGFKIAAYVTLDAPAPGVDTPEDLARVRELFRA